MANRFASLWGAFASTNASPAPTSRKRKAEKPAPVVYESDAKRIQGKLDELPMVLVREARDMRPREVRKALLRLGCKDAADVVEAEELARLYQLQLQRLVPCSVCLSTPTEGEFAIFLPCGHSFHRDCIHSWAQDDYEEGRRCKRDEWYRPRCPNCRAPAV